MADVEYDIDSDTTVDLIVPDPINTNSGIQLQLTQPSKTKSSPEVQPFKTESSADLKLELVQPFKTSSEIDVKPLELTLKPLKADLDLDTDSNLTLDLKPAVVDLCLTANIGKVPNLRVNLPYQHHVAFTWFGTEIWGLTFSGQQDIVTQELKQQPKVVWGGSRTTPPGGAGERRSPSREVGGLRVRLGD